jgi:nucleoside-diphosphate-sugar epimerase
MKLTDKRILVTGADGFIGSHLTEMLLSNGGRVRALSQYNSFNDWGWLEQIPPCDNLEVVCGDVRDPHFCKEITKEIDVIFHLAALIAIPYSYVAPDSYVDTNIKGTLNICQAARENG